jgi:omega-6 fatty acid desaturase (delta-12 desaturase)
LTQPLATHQPNLDETVLTAKALRSEVAAFETPIATKAALQLVTSVGLFFIGCAAMYLAYPISYLLTLALAIPTGGLLVRVFIVQHDCGHDAFFASRRLNDIIGGLCSLLTLTPYRFWRRHHAVHHGNWNNLDRRPDGGDMYSSCLTVTEYRALSRRGRFVYRVQYHPLVANLLLPPVIFLLFHRVPFDTPREWVRERQTVYGTDLVLVAILAVAGLLLGFREVLAVQIPIIAVASIVGAGLFTLQHRFEHTVWARHSEWNFVTAALAGSSYLRLPRVLQWFTGNIGFHHIHHLSPRVPNYRLQECHEAVAALRTVPKLSLWSALKAARLALWDEDRQRMVGFADVAASIQTKAIADTEADFQAAIGVP